MRHRFLRAAGRRLLYPTYVQDYLDRVTAADVAAGNTSGLELGVTDAADTFIQGLVSDTVLGVSGGVISQAASVIKASVPMAGARTRLGAMTPLVGPAPTSFNFVDADYNRETGLWPGVNNSAKYLDSNRADSAEGQNNAHISVYISTVASSAGVKSYIGANTATTGLTGILRNSTIGLILQTRGVNNSIPVVQPETTPGFKGATRSNSTQMTRRFEGATATVSYNSTVPTANNNFVFAFSTPANAPTAFGDGRLAFYSIGESLDLALLDARVTALINAYAAAI